LIQYAVEEAVAAGITTLIFITGRTKRAIGDHFDKAYELEAELAARGKTELLETVQDTVPNGVDFVFIRQRETLGLGHAVLSARTVVGEEPFAVLLADDLIDGNGKGVIAQMCDQFHRYQCSMLGVERVPAEETHKYGIVQTLPFTDGLSNVEGIVEKPRPADAPSNLAVVGRYILTPRIFNLLERTERGAGDEIQLTDGIAALLREEQVLAYEFKGRRYDCGSKLGYLTANVEYGLRHPELGDEFREYLKGAVEHFGLAQPLEPVD
jgi:UTP--glucose-1-phosphate uridylyltransferase